MLGPHGSDKLPSDPVIGQKGVGLTYTIFISNYYLIETTSITGGLEGEVKNAASWKNGSSDDIPKFIYHSRVEGSFSPTETHTRVLVKDIERIYDDTEEIFSQTFPVLKYLIRTKTAVGNAKAIFGESESSGVEDISKTYRHRRKRTI